MAEVLEGAVLQQEQRLVGSSATSILQVPQRSVAGSRSSGTPEGRTCSCDIRLYHRKERLLESIGRYVKRQT